MAIDTLLHVLNNSKAKKSHRLVLIEIANHINADGLAWPSYQRLANRTGLTRSWVIKIVSQLQAVGELEILPNSSPTGGQAYRIPTGVLSTPGMKSRGVVSSQEVVYSVDPNLIYESVYCTNDTEDYLTAEQAVAFGLTPGSRLFKKATGELKPEE
jgi:Helix-turn-helix domain